ncbi:MAG: hypothetical protein L3K08_00875, partial [Thermoplasmata archaeon]|nr:hypothetical protein [Thermoplasmata archaeon]
MPTDRTPPEYGTCRACGDAVPPEAAACPICGAAEPIRPNQVGGLKGAKRHRFKLLQYGRSVVVVGVVVGLAVLLVQA